MANDRPRQGVQQTLLGPDPEEVIIVNGRCEIHEDEGIRVAMVSGIPVARYAVGERVGEHLFVANAQLSGFATQQELSDALGLGIRTVQRIKQRFVEGGVAALEWERKGGAPVCLGAAEETAIRKWHAENKSGREMARRLKVSPGAVQNALKRLGLPARPRGGTPLPLFSGEVGGGEPEEGDPDGEPEPEAPSPAPPAETEREPSPTLEPVAGQQPSYDVDPRHRALDRLLATQGKLLDAEPVFWPARRLPRAGVLLAVPMLVSSGLLDEAAALYGDLGPAFYGLRTTLMTLLFMALLRIKRPENLKEYAPVELGRLLGLDRAPEVKTLRRKLTVLAAGMSETLLMRLAARRVASRDEALGFLYVDGHVRVYHGKRTIPKTHVARIRLSMPAAQDTWVHDAEGDPLFFVTQEAHPSLVQALPVVLDEVRELVGTRRVTVVFDRGGWSPKLFAAMVEQGFDVLTYRKGKAEPVPDEDFEVVVAPGTDGKTTWELADGEIVVGRDKLRMRQITRRRGSHQTHIVTTRRDLEAPTLAWRMFNRWRQENYFKYARHEYALDALAEYGAEDDDQLRDVPNPAWAEADKAYKRARAATKRLEADYGAKAFDNPESKRPTMRGFKIAHGTEIGIPLRDARAAEAEAKSQRDALPRRVAVGDLERKPERLLARKKRLIDSIKMVAWQAETDLVRAMAPHYARTVDEGRTMIATALQSTADLELADGELRVRLRAQSSPHRTRAIHALCQHLNQTDTCFPGTDLRLRYAVEGAEPAT
jgi:transposase